MSSSKDMTRGAPLPLMIRFAIPIIGSFILQQCYSMCDSIIIGRLLGVEAFAAVGSTAFLNWLPVSMLMGLCQGFGVLMSQRFGAGDIEGLRKVNGASVLMALLGSLLMTTAGVVFLRPVLSLLRTAPELMDQAAEYLRLVWLGLSITALYNVFATLLRAMGDSRTPLFALIVSTVVNIVLDFVLVAAIPMGVSGVALATVLAQLVSLVYCILRLRKCEGVLPSRTEYRLHKEQVQPLLRLGLPPLFRDGVISVGGLFIQAAINGFGIAFVAGVTAAKRYFVMLEMAGGGMEGALATFVGQNMGAGKTQRVFEGTRSAVRLALLMSVVSGALAALLAQPMIELFVTAAEPEVVRFGVESIRITTLFLPALYALYLYRAALQSMGDTFVPMLSGFAELLMRVVCVLSLAGVWGRYSVYLADGLGWVLAAALLGGTYYYRKRKMQERPASV